jgi:antitoxin VapB
LALSIKHLEADRLARELAAQTGESITNAVVAALRERLARIGTRTAAHTLHEEIHAIRARCARLPIRDPASPDTIIGYDKRGLTR